MQCLSARVAELEQKLVVQPIYIMSESILTASYRNTSISDSERQSIINAAVAAVDSTKPRYKQVSVDFTKTIRATSSTPKHEYGNFTHGMKTIQTAQLIVSNRIYIECVASSEMNPSELISGYEVPLTTTPLTLLTGNWYGNATTLKISYNSSNVVVEFICSTTGSSNNSTFHGSGVVRFYGIY